MSSRRRTIAFVAFVLCIVGGGTAVWMFFGMLGAGVPLAPEYTTEDQQSNFILGAGLGAIVGAIVALTIVKSKRRTGQ